MPTRALPPQSLPFTFSSSGSRHQGVSSQASLRGASSKHQMPSQETWGPGAVGGRLESQFRGVGIPKSSTHIPEREGGACWQTTVSSEELSAGLGSALQASWESDA